MLQIQVALGEHLIAILEKVLDKLLHTSKPQKDEKNSMLSSFDNVSFPSLSSAKWQKYWKESHFQYTPCYQES